MAVRYSDADIATFLADRKPLASDFRDTIRFRDKGASEECDVTVIGSSGTEYQIRLRRSKVNPLDFSVILAVCPTGTNAVFRLRRYNGKSHEHTNSLERQRFFEFHIHQATQRYQEVGPREDKYAEITSGYSDLWTALDCMLKDCGFVTAPDIQLRLPEE